MKAPVKHDPYRSYQEDAQDWEAILKETPSAKLPQLLDADVVWALDRTTRVATLCYGAATLERIAKSNKAERISVLAFFVDFSPRKGDLKKLLAAITAVKGNHEYTS